MTPPTRRLIVPVIAAGLPLTFAVPAQGQEAAADPERQQQLEQRIEQLERQLRELTEKLSAPPPVPEPAPKTADAPVIQVKPITPNAVPGTRFSYSGFVKLDTMVSKYDDGEIADGSIGRDFYLPSTIPVGGVGESVDFDSHIKQSRFIFGTDTDLAN